MCNNNLDDAVYSPNCLLTKNTYTYILLVEPRGGCLAFVLLTKWPHFAQDTSRLLRTAVTGPCPRRGV